MAASISHPRGSPTRTSWLADSALAHSAMVEAGRFQNRTEAEIARSLLATVGIPSILVADEAGGVFPMDLSGGARLLVAGADAEDAALILARRMRDEKER